MKPRPTSRRPAPYFSKSSRRLAARHISMFRTSKKKAAQAASMMDNHQVDTVTLMNAKNDAVTLQVDSATHLPVKKSFTIRDPQSRERDEISEVYDNWKQVQGVMAPYNLTLLKNGELTYQRFISAISFNTHPSENIFAPLVNFDRNKK